MTSLRRGYYDANGNLLSDSENTCTCDSANRLVEVRNQSTVTSYQYNGLGDRLSQNGVNYTLDLNAGLTQVLSDSENTYTYGIGRISQQNGAATEYFLGDALGSVRQLVDGAGQITLVKSYEPYGSVVSSVGSDASAFGFTGEWTDVTGLVYLRARYYAPWDGRFVGRDSFSGLEEIPATLNYYAYGLNNPVSYVDPGGALPWPLVVLLVLLGITSQGCSLPLLGEAGPIPTLVSMEARTSYPVILSETGLYGELRPNGQHPTEYPQYVSFGDGITIAGIEFIATLEIPEGGTSALLG